GVPGTGPATADGATRLVLDVAGRSVRAGDPAGHAAGGAREEEPVLTDAALLVSAELTGCVAHPAGSLDRLRLPAGRPGPLLVLADWRVDRKSTRLNSRHVK